MKTKLNSYFPFTQDDILTLRGNPVAKLIDAGRNGSGTTETWIYYNIPACAGGTADRSLNTKECYMFKNNRLIGWTKNPV